MSTWSTTGQQQLQAAPPCLLLPEPLTLPLARQVFLLSFYLSQGQPSIQLSLFQWLALARPHWRLSAEASRAVLALAPAVRKLAARGVHAPYRLTT